MSVIWPTPLSKILGEVPPIGNRGALLASQRPSASVRVSRRIALLAVGMSILFIGAFGTGIRWHTSYLAPWWLPVAGTATAVPAMASGWGAIRADPRLMRRGALLFAAGYLFAGLSWFVAWNGDLLHDWVLATLLTAARQQATGELRRYARTALDKLRQTRLGTDRDETIHAAQAAAAIRSAVDDAGFGVTWDVEISAAPDATYPSEMIGAFGAGIGEALRNSYRHGDPAISCTADLRIDQDAIDAQPRQQHKPRPTNTSATSPRSAPLPCLCSKQSRPETSPKANDAMPPSSRPACAA